MVYMAYTQALRVCLRHSASVEPTGGCVFSCHMQLCGAAYLQSQELPRDSLLSDMPAEKHNWMPDIGDQFAVNIRCFVM